MQIPQRHQIVGMTLSLTGKRKCMEGENWKKLAEKWLTIMRENGECYSIKLM